MTAIDWQQPWILLTALPIMAWVLWLHLRQRAPLPEIMFPAMRFLSPGKLVHQNHHLRHRLHDPLRLLLRLLLIACLACAFAGPTIDNPNQDATSSDTRTTLMQGGVNEYSMNISAEVVDVPQPHKPALTKPSKPRVLLWTAQPSINPPYPAALIRHALEPWGKGDARNKMDVDVQPVQTWFEPTGAGYQLLVMVEPGPFSPADITSLRQILHQGGRVIYFIGSGQDAQNIELVRADFENLALEFKQLSLELEQRITIKFPFSADTTPGILSANDDLSNEAQWTDVYHADRGWLVEMNIDLSRSKLPWQPEFLPWLHAWAELLSDPVDAHKTTPAGPQSQLVTSPAESNRSLQAGLLLLSLLCLLADQWWPRVMSQSNMHPFRESP